MAKKTKTKDSYQGDPGDEHIEKTVTMEDPQVLEVKVEPKKNTWEIKDRQYFLMKKNNMKEN